MKASLATARQKAGEGSGSVASPRSPPAAGAGGNPFAGLGGGAGGMPDLASLMSNPQLMQAAQQMMGVSARPARCRPMYWFPLI